jgi:heme exporter protein A
MFSQSFTVTDLCGARGGFWLFEGLTFALQPGEALLVRGANGAGKSTLLRILAGLLSPADGTIAYGLTDEQPPPLHFLGHTNAIKSGLSVEQNIQFWAEFAGVEASAQDEAIDATLDAFNLDGLRDLPARYLSAGQKRRLALARLVASPAPLWLLDEPTTALDTASTSLFEQAIQAHRKVGGMAIIATHQELSVPGAQSLNLETCQ